MKNIFTPYILLLSLLFLFFIFSCKQENIKTGTIPDNAILMDSINNQLAKTLVNFSDNTSLTLKVFDEVSTNSKKNRDERIGFDDEENTAFLNGIKEIITAEMLRLLQDNEIEIYWPYSSNWDKITNPTITFKPTELKDSNIGYIKENNIIKQVVVTDDYAKTNPVWIIRKKENINYDLIKLSENEPVLGNTRIFEPNATVTHRLLYIPRVKFTPSIKKSTLIFAKSAGRTVSIRWVGVRTKAALNDPKKLMKILYAQGNMQSFTLLAQNCNGALFELIKGDKDGLYIGTVNSDDFVQIISVAAPQEGDPISSTITTLDHFGAGMIKDQNFKFDLKGEWGSGNNKKSGTLTLNMGTTWYPGNYVSTETNVVSKGFGATLNESAWGTEDFLVKFKNRYVLDGGWMSYEAYLK